MRGILRKHGHAIFLAERVGVLEVYARLLAGHRGRVPRSMWSPPGARIKPGKKMHHVPIRGRSAGILRNRREACRYHEAAGHVPDLSDGGGDQPPTWRRHLELSGVTSDVKSLIQGLGRIDRIDSPNPRIHYHTFDLPGLVLSSDHKARAPCCQYRLTFWGPVRMTCPRNWSSLRPEI